MKYSVKSMLKHSSPYVPKERWPEYFLIFTSCILGMLFNLGLIILFYTTGVPLLAHVSVVSVFLWLCAMIVNYRGKIRLAISISTFELLAHTILGVYVLGTDYGFQYFVWAALCLITLNPQVNKGWVIFFGSICLVIFIWLNMVFPAKTNIRPFEGFEDIIFVIMIVVSAGSLLTGLLVMKSIFFNQQHKLIEFANSDALTGLNNRRFFYTFLDSKRINKREAVNFCIALIDLDHFKKINDNFGHDVGDDVLVELSTCLTALLNNGETLCRWGVKNLFYLFLTLT